MASANPHVIWQGHSFDWHAGPNPKTFLDKILKDAEKRASSHIITSTQGQLTESGLHYRNRN